MTTTVLRALWTRRTKISTGVLLAALAVAGGTKAYAAAFGADCCAPGAPCCHPGAACCAKHKQPAT